MADFSNALANILLDAIPTTYAAPSTTLPNLDGTNVTEPGQLDYVRPSITFAAASNRSKVSTNVCDFISGGIAASGSAGPFPYMAFYSASSGGTFYGRATLTTPLAWVSGQQVELAAGDITWALPS